LSDDLSRLSIAVQVELLPEAQGAPRGDTRLRHRLIEDEIPDRHLAFVVPEVSAHRDPAGESRVDLEGDWTAAVIRSWTLHGPAVPSAEATSRASASALLWMTNAL
jgi:hypothetical protein